VTAALYISGGAIEGEFTAAVKRISHALRADLKGIRRK
jgi:hypothetical protein